MAHSREEILINFVPSRGITTTKKKKDTKQKTTLCGNEIRNFYEDVLSDNTSTVQDATASERKSEPIEKLSNKIDIACGRYKSSSEETSLLKSDAEKKRREHKLFQSSQDGNILTVMKCLKHVDVNIQDFYGWTPLMCASYAGHNDIVKILLEKGSDLTIKENTNRTARDLALASNHKDTAKLIDTFVNEEDSNCDEIKDEQGFYCDVCKNHFTEGSFKSHCASTVHLFNRQLKPSQPSYLITESNVGYQMMLRSGWNINHGLGPSGEGQKYPVKTVLKRDRKGLGKETKTNAKVTHFKPKDEEAVRTVVHRDDRIESVRSVSRRAMRRKERKEKDWERRLRQYMNTD